MVDLQMVSGLPEIQEQNEFYEGCHLEKQTKNVFLDKHLKL